MNHFFEIYTMACFPASLAKSLSTNPTTESHSDICSSHLFSTHCHISSSSFASITQWSCSLAFSMAWLGWMTSGSNPKKVSSEVKSAVEDEGEEVEMEVEAI